MVTGEFILMSSDGKAFEVNEAVALHLKEMKAMIKSGCADGDAYLLNVTNEVLTEVMECCNKCREASNLKEKQATLSGLLVAYYSNINNLCQPVAHMITDLQFPIILKSSDEEKFVVDVAVAWESQLIKLMTEDQFADDDMPLPNVTLHLPNVTSKILAKVIEYCKKHVEAKTPKEDLKAWDADFMKVDQATLFELILAANYLDNKGLLDLTCQTVADMIKGKTPEEIRKIFNIEVNCSPEEEEEIRRENQWAFE